MITPIARSITLPLEIKSRKSLSIGTPLLKMLKSVSSQPDTMIRAAFALNLLPSPLLFNFGGRK
jgi:hypothetical protein